MSSWIVMNLKTGSLFLFWTVQNRFYVQLIRISLDLVAETQSMAHVKKELLSNFCNLCLIGGIWKSLWKVITVVFGIFILICYLCNRNLTRKTRKEGRKRKRESKRERGAKRSWEREGKDNFHILSSRVFTKGLIRVSEDRCRG